MDSILCRSGLSPQEKLTGLATLQGRFEKIRKDAGVLFSSSSFAAAPPEVANYIGQQHPKMDDNNEGDNEEEEVEAASSERHEAGDSDDEEIPDPLSPTLKKVRNLGMEGQYERKARNVMLKFNNAPEIITANRAGELVVNGIAVPESNFASLFRSVFSRMHDLEQPGINQFLGALRQQ